MALRVDSYVQQASGVLQFNGGGTQYEVEIPNGNRYLFAVDNASDLTMKKSSDGGLTWSLPVAIFSGTMAAVSVWYDRWSGINADLIHVAYLESVGSDVLYRNVDAANSDALSTQTTVFAGASSATGSAFSIWKTRGGNLLCRGCIDAGAEPFFVRSVDNGANWTTRATTGATAIATQDQYLGVPGFASDNQDAMMLFWDASANAILKQIYDNSADSWTESTLASSMTDVAATTSFPHFAAAVDLTNSKILAIAWNGVDTANADLLCYYFDESTSVAKTDVVTNSTDDQGLAAIGIATDSGWWYAFYVGKSDGSEVVGTSVNAYYKISKDSGATWGSETLLTTIATNYRWLITCPRFTGAPRVALHLTSVFNEIRSNVSVPRVPCLAPSIQAIESGVCA